MKEGLSLMKNNIESTKENVFRNSAKNTLITKKSLKGIFALIVVTAIALGCFMLVAGALEEAIYGDVDHDGTVSATDARLILRKSVGLEKLCDELADNVADMDFDNQITPADARLALRSAVGLTPLVWYPSGTYVTPSTGENVDPIVGEKTSFKDLKLGEIGKKGNVYIGLQYVKVMDCLPTALGKENISSDNEVVLAFFEFYNGNDSMESVNPDDVTCYVDGFQAIGVKTYIKVFVDGISQYYSTELDAGCQLISVQDFEVTKGWNEIKFFYKSDCVWTISSNDVSSDDYQATTLFAVDDAKDKTNVDDIIFSDKYDVQYKGIKIYHYSNTVSDKYYAVFKYCITNNDSEALNTSLMGYNMRAYCNNFFIGEASYALDDKVDGFINIYDINSIESGMSSNIYIAFETQKTNGNFYMIYDDGYITDHFCGTVYAQVE